MLHIKRILVATDFSKGSEKAHQQAAIIAEKWNGKVDMIHIVPTFKYLNESVLTLGLPLNMDRDIYPKLLEQAEDRVQEEMEKYYPESNRGEIIVNTGRKPSEEILNRMAKGSYDIMIIGAQGASSHILFGGTVEQIVRHSPVPVLTVSEKFQSRPFTNILVPTDGSERSLAVLPMALLMAHAFDTKITLLHILELYGSVAEDVHIYQGDNELGAIRQELVSKVQRLMWNQYGDKVCVRPSSENKSVHVRWEEGKPGFDLFMTVQITKSVSAHYEIIDRSEEEFDLVAMTTHGRTGIAHMLLGSTTEKVVRHAKTSVLTLRPKMDK